MKNPAVASILLTLGLCSGTTAALADQNESLSLLKTVTELESAGDLNQAYAVALDSIERLSADLKIGNVVERIDTRLRIIQDEVVTERNTARSSMGFSLSGLLSTISGSGQMAYSSSTEKTQIIVRNPLRLAEFPWKTQKDLIRLKEELIEYIQDNATEIAALKTLAVRALEISIRRADKGHFTPESEIKHVLEVASGLNFSGQQKVTVCTVTNYADTTQRTNSSIGLKLDLLLIGGSFSSGSHELKETFAHSEQTCQSTINEINANDTRAVWMVNLSALDRSLHAWGQAALLKSALSPNNDTPFPIWGSPYYGN